MDLFGWRAAFFVPGLASVALGIAFLLLVPDPGPVQKKSKTIGLSVDRATMARIFAILVVATACGGVIFNSTTVAMPKVFDERLRELTQTNFGIGALVAFVYSVAAFAQVVVGSLIDRIEMRRLMITIGLVQIPLLALAANSQGWLMLAAAILMMLAVFGQIPINDAIVARHTDAGWRSRVYALRYVVSFGASSLSVPLVAALHGGQGFAPVFMALAAIGATTAIAALFFPGIAREASAAGVAPAPVVRAG
jgi:MFS family permease